MSHDSPTPHLPSLTPSCLRVPIRPQPPLPSSPDLAHSHPLRLGNEQIAHQPLPSPLPRIQLSVSPPHSARILPPCARIFAPSARIFPLSARIFPPSARIFPPSARVSPLSACAALPRITTGLGLHTPGSSFTPSHSSPLLPTLPHPFPLLPTPLQGGRWCLSPSQCRLRADTELGSTKGWPRPGDSGFESNLDSKGAGFQGMLSGDLSGSCCNSWNMMVVLYCDEGASFRSLNVYCTECIPSLIRPPCLSPNQLDSMGAGFQGMLSGDSSENPFYSWNMVVVLYCDGGVFAGVKGKALLFPTLLLPPSPNIPPLSTPNPLFPSLRSQQSQQQGSEAGGYRPPYRLVHLNNKGLKQANSVLLTGCSAGAIAVSMACDAMAQFHFPRTAKVKCLMDAGFFMDTPDITGQYSFRGIVQRMFRFHSMTAAADDDCRTVLFILHLTPFPFPLFIPSLSSIKSFPPQ
ncbi:unnamed protein product [Closterium sp. NIES-65]|nr:unnamed protein product [Closterium sp. NIES-65]